LIYSTEVLLFFNIIREHSDAFVFSWHGFKNSVVVETRLVFTTSYEELFPFLHYCGISDLSGVAWAPQTSINEQGQDCRVDCPEVSSEIGGTAVCV
jgi:hypothetical protein